LSFTASDDAIYELAESFAVTLDTVSGGGATGAGSVGTGTVVSDEAPPTVSINDITIHEGGVGGPATASFTISIDRATYEDVSVTWSVADVTTLPSDTTGPTSGTATIAAGTTSVAVSPALSFTASDDSIYELAESFAVTLDTVSGGGATGAGSVGTGTVISDDINTAPVAGVDTVLTNIVDGSSITFPIASLLVNDSDAEGDALSGFAIVGGSAIGGTAVISGSDVVFTPDPGAFSAGSFSYTVSDGALTSAPALVSIAASSGDTIAGGAGSEILIGNDMALTLSTLGDATLGGLTFGDDDLAEYVPATDTAALSFDGGALFSNGSEDVDAVHVLANGHIILSTIGDATLGGLTFGKDDLVDYDPVADTATLLFDGGALFSNTSEDIDAAHVLANGHIVLSTTDDATLGGLTFGDDDLVEYDPVADTATLIFDGGALFSSGFEDIDAVHVLDNGHFVLSTIGNATLGGLSFGDDDLVDYDPVADTATLLFDGGASFSNAAEDVDAAFVSGDSTLTGGAGDDWLDGGDGPDTLTGGSGSDVFAFGAGDSGVDQITDFDVANDANADNDSFDVSDLLTVDPTGDPVATYVSITDTGTGAVMSVNPDGVSGFTPVATLAGVSSGDVIQVILDPDDPVATVTVA
ncbi:MAG: Ig-like domain-containing protein, partial [Alphaproteobacteria bacterium]